MVTSKGEVDVTQSETTVTTAKKRRLRRKKLHAALTGKFKDSFEVPSNTPSLKVVEVVTHATQDKCIIDNNNILYKINMSSKETNKLRDEVLAARNAKKLSKQSKNKGEKAEIKKTETPDKNIAQKVIIGRDSNKIEVNVNVESNNLSTLSQITSVSTTCRDEVDKAILKTDDKFAEKSKEQIKAERVAKKAAKQAQKKTVDTKEDISVKDVVETLNDIVTVAKEVQEVTAKVQAIDLEVKQPQELSKSKADLRAERRAKQEAQRAAKQAQEKAKTTEKTAKQPSSKVEKSIDNIDITKEKSPKPKTLKSKQLDGSRLNWFQHLNNQHDKDSLKNIAINSNLHPAIVKLGVQLAAHVVYGSNARCVALLDAIKKMVSDYTLPAKTEFARGLESHLASSLDFLWKMRQPSASQTNAVKFFRHQLTQLPNNVDEFDIAEISENFTAVYVLLTNAVKFFRHQLTQLPNNVDEFDAKKKLHEEIDRYIREQIDMAGEAISMTVRKKIADGDNILVYGCSSLIERILVEAWEAGLRFRAVVAGERGGARGGGGRELARRLAPHGPVTYVDITALSFVINTVSKVVLSASAVLATGGVVGARGSAQVALVARAHQRPVLVACETHKFADTVHTDAFDYNELGDPDDLIDIDDKNSPLKDWRSNPNLTPLNLMYDVTPPSLVTAMVTELAILPCTSAPVVLRFKLSEYGL